MAGISSAHLQTITEDWRIDEKIQKAWFARRNTPLFTCDHMVTYSAAMLSEDAVFKALADASRRFLLDRLYTHDGQSLSDLESGLKMTRFGVMKHLRVLEEAGLVLTRRSGREKLHFLNAVPIRLIHDRWIDKYTEREVSALVNLKASLETSASAGQRKKA
jgi:DNA-binding transcriptional ArsR family regulator